MKRRNIIRNRTRHAIAACVLITAAICSQSVSAAERISAQVALDKDQLYLGDSVTLRLQIKGSDKPQKPDIRAFNRDFSVAHTGGGPSSSERASIINGRMTRVVNKSYVFNYRLTPKRAGNLIIPSIKLTAEGSSFQTAPINIKVDKPSESDNFKVRMSLSTRKCYVGQPILLTVTWYRSQEARSLSFSMPALDNPEIEFADMEPTGRQSLTRFRIPLPSGEVIGLQGSSRLEGKNYNTITFHKVLIPQRSGSYTVPPTTAISDVLTGYQKSNGPFGGFMGRQGIYKKVSAVSSALQLTVLDLPDSGRPSNFSGHVGQYKLSASATPAVVSVGDPITLTIAVSGPKYFKDVQIPPLKTQELLAQDFRLPSEIAAARLEGAQKIFTQTIRATRSDITEIPAIELPYFDTTARQYRIARSTPIPLEVKKTRVVTAIDGEGAEITAAGSALEAWSKGIAHNYAGMSLLANQRWGISSWAGSPLWLSILALPPFAYLAVLLSTVTLRKRNADPTLLKARKAYRLFAKEISAMTGELNDGTSHVDVRLLDAIRSYLGSKLRMPSAAMTFTEASAPLADRGITTEGLAELNKLFTECEASSYAGSASSVITNPQDTLTRAAELIREIDTTLS